MNEPLKSMKWWGWGDESIEFDISERPALWQYLSSNFKLPDNLQVVPPVSFDSISLPPQKPNRKFATELACGLGPNSVCDSKMERLRHAFGKSLRDLWRVRQGIVPYAPDYVVYPGCHDDVCTLVDLAVKHGVALIPFGGGSNIAGCLEPVRQTDRTVVSVDMTLMNRLLSLD